MKRIQIKFANLGTISLGFPVFNKKLSKTEKLTKALTYLQQYLIIAFITLLPLSGYLYPDATFESSVFYYVIYFAIANLFVFLSLLLLRGKKRLTDPTGFMVVLTFALMTTTSAIFVSNPTVVNTFGDDNFRALSGILIMALLAIFYIASMVINDRKLWLISIYGFVISSLLLLYSLVLNSVNIYNYTILFLSIPLLLALGMRSKVLRCLNAVGIFIILLLPFVKEIFSTSSTNKILILYPESTIFAFFVGSFSLLSVILIKKNHEVYKLFTNFYKSVKNAKFLNTLKYLMRILILISPAFILGFFIYLWIDSGNVARVWELNIDSFQIAIDNLWQESLNAMTNIKNVLFGLGGEYSVSSNSLFFNIFYTQGILGVFAYLVLFGYTIFLTYKNIIKSIKTSDFFINCAFFLSAVYILISSLLAYFSIYTSIVVWVILILSSNYNSFDLKKFNTTYIEKDFSISKNNFKNPKFNFFLLRLRTILAILLLVVIFVCLYFTKGAIDN